MRYRGMIGKSRTLDYAALLAAFGAIQQGLPEMQMQLAGYYGWVFIAVAGIMAYLRAKTNGPVGDK